MRVLGGTAGNKTPEIHQYNVQFANEKIPVALKKAILDGCQESHFNGSYLFDNKKTLYCTKKFTDSRMVMFPEVMGNFPAHHAPYYPDPCPKEMEKRKVELVYEKTISPSDCVWIYDLIFKKCLYGIGFTPIGRTFYDSYATLEYPHLGLQFWPGKLNVNTLCTFKTFTYSLSNFIVFIIVFQDTMQRLLLVKRDFLFAWTR